MKYGHYIKSQLVPEWKEAYINYKMLKKILKPYKVMSKIYLKVDYPENKEKNLNQKVVTITNASQGELDRLAYFGKKFSDLVILESQKMYLFFQLKYEEDKAMWTRFKINVAILQNIQNENQYEIHRLQLKNCFHFFYKELSLLIEYVNINQEALRKIVKKYKKFSKVFSTDHKKLKALVVSSKNNLETNLHKLITFRNEVETVYLSNFYKKYNQKDGQIELRKISTGKLITQQQSFLFGFFSGFAFLLCIVIFALFIFFQITSKYLMQKDDEIDDPTEETEFRGVLEDRRMAFFRSMVIMIIYGWTLAINVYVWTNYNINYKQLFSFNHHFSDIWEILKRMAFFTLILQFSALIFLVGYETKEFLMGKVILELAMFTPTFVFFSYLFFPIKNWFNWMGRLYVFKLLKNIVISPFLKADFKLLWAMDQFFSFAIFFRDLESIALYYMGFWNTETDLNLDYYIINFIIICFIIQSLKSQSLTTCDRFLNFSKYVSLFIVLLLDHLTRRNPEEAKYITLFATISTFSFILWDFKLDWNLLKSDCKYRYLRRELSFENKSIYYVFLVSNIFLRCLWMMGLCRNMRTYWSLGKLFSTIAGVLEMARRCLWNYLIVEKEHVQNCGIFKAVEEINLPFENIEFEEYQGEEKESEHNIEILIRNPSECQNASFSHIAEQDLIDNPFEKPNDEIDEKNNDKISYFKPPEINEKSFYLKPSDKINEKNIEKSVAYSSFIIQKSHFNVQKGQKKINNFDGIIDTKSEIETPLMSGTKIKFEKCISVLELDKEMKKRKSFTKENFDLLLNEINEFCELLKKTMELRFKVVDKLFIDKEDGKYDKRNTQIRQNNSF